MLPTSAGVEPATSWSPVGQRIRATWYKFTYLMANSADPDQLASLEANWSGSTLSAKAGYIQDQQDQGL